MRTAHEVSSDKPLKTTLKDFYGNRKTDLEMLDNHKAFLEADPDHTKMTLKRFLGMRKRERLALLEVGPGNGRNTETTLMEYFGRIDMIEPSDNLRKTAIERMEALDRPYDNIFRVRSRTSSPWLVSSMMPSSASLFSCTAVIVISLLSSERSPRI